MPHPNVPTRRPWARVYSALLYLYPARFRRRFGPAMADAFDAMSDQHGALHAWWAVGTELLPTLASEHAAALRQVAADPASRAALFLTPLRIALACAVPGLAYAWLIRHATRAEDVAAATLWLGGMTAGIVRARGRGWASVGGAVMGAAIGMAGLIAYDAAAGSPQVLAVAPLLLAVSAAVAFTLSNYVRLVIEGIDLGRAVPGRAQRNGRS